jgi:hypothetical protein
MVSRNQIVGPLLFGVVYIKTVATFPEAMFYVLIVVVLLSLFFLFLVKIPPHQGVVDAEVEAQDTVVSVPPIVVDDDEEASTRGCRLSRTLID